MSGMYHDCDQFKNINAAALAAFLPNVGGFIMNAMEAAAKEAEEKAIKEKLNESLNKWSQPQRPGPDLRLHNTQGVAAILKAKDRNKSSKGKHPTNYTPPKKKRK
jgi:hypothetical protein